MTASIQGRPKSLSEAKQWMRERLAARTHPMNAIDPDEGLAAIDRLTGLDGESWAAMWGAAGDAARAEAQRAESDADTRRAAALYAKASAWYFMGRFPCPNHPAKLRCAELERETYLAAAKHWEHSR